MSRFSASLAAAMLVAFLLSGTIAMFLRMFADLPKFSDVGYYPDSYVLYDVDQFSRTGIIYRSPDTPPFPAAMYSPMLYIALSIPQRIVQLANPFIGPRLIVLIAFAACCFAAGSLTRALVPIRGARTLGAMLAASMAEVSAWVIVLRADLLGVAFGLWSIRLLLAAHPAAPFVAGAFAGVAWQFKLTFVAAGTAGLLWLALRRQFRKAAFFMLGGLLFGPLMYGYFHLREPHMLAGITSIGLSMREYAGLGRHVLRAVSEPVFLLALAAGHVLILKKSKRWALLFLYASISFAVAITTGMQPGADINYFFEVLFALTPMAAYALFREFSARRGAYVGALFIGFFLTAYSVIPNLRTIRGLVVTGLFRESRIAQEQRLLGVQEALRGYRTLSLVPRVSLFTRDPLIIEPFFLSFAQRAGKFDTMPIRNAVRERAFDAVVMYPSITTFRGIPNMPPDIFREVQTSYTPFCATEHFVVHLRGATDANEPLRRALTTIGCSVPPDISKSVPLITGIEAAAIASERLGNAAAWSAQCFISLRAPDRFGCALPR